MPPLRTMSSVKPVKTERTHEENQERAYIAASRRSDRSLEARVESARRASEIHKRRTGRSLRVTEQDVINEEMYEEEDDDLPLQYRRLTANLQTGSLEFNRKLAAYLTHNVAVRSALNQAINESFAQQYPGIQQHPQSVANPMFPSPLNTTNLQPGLTQSPLATPTSPHPYRQTPYPMPGTTGFRGEPVHKRANSLAVPFDDGNQTTSTYQANNSSGIVAPSNFRRMSMPAATSVKPEIKSETIQNGPLSATASPLVSGQQKDLKKPSSVGKMGPPPQQTPQQQQHINQQEQQPFFDFQQSSMDPLTMTLPPDAQQLLGASLPLNDPFTNMLLGGNNQNNMFGMNNYMGNEFLQTGMNSTLAPNAYNLNDSGLTTPLGMDQSGRSLNQNLTDFKGVHYAADQSSAGNTPGGENSFDAWINDSWTGENT